MSSLKALAQSLGLSITTVSRALDGYSDVSAATRKRVVQAAEEIGYRPNAAARRLRRGTSEVVTLVLPTSAGQFNEPLYIELMAAMAPVFAAKGLDLMLMAAAPGPEEMKTYRRIVEGRRADGLIVVRTRRDDARVRYLLEQNVPFVLMGRSDSAGPCAFVDGDGEEAFADAVARLAALGHRRIAHVAAPSAFTFAQYRRAGYERGMARAGLEPLIIEEPNDMGGGEHAAHALLGRADRPTAILCATDRIAFGVLRAARAEGISVPRDLSVVGHDNVPACEFTDPPLTTMELPIAETGERLAAMLIERIGGADPATLQHVSPLRWIERGSTGPAPG